MPAFIAAIGLVSLATPFLDGQYYQRWFVWPGLAVAVPMPLLVTGTAIMLWRAIGKGGDGSGLAHAVHAEMISDLVERRDEMGMAKGIAHANPRHAIGF